MRTENWKYTIIITKQEGEYVILPDSATSWEYILGDTIRFLNKTKSNVTVILNPEGWLNLKGDNPINAGGYITGEVMKIADPKAPPGFTFFIPTDEVFVVSGGPKMVPTEPVDR